MKFFLCVLGTVLVVEGMPWFLSPRSMRRFLSQMMLFHEGRLRMVGVFLMLSGLLLVYLGTTFWGK